MRNLAAMPSDPGARSLRACAQSRTRWRALLLLAGLLLVPFAGCSGGGLGHGSQSATGSAASGSAWTSITTRTIPPGQRVRGDGDADNPGDIDGNGDSDSAAVGGPDNDNDTPTPASYRFPDGDDRASLAYGHAPSAGQRRAIVDVVKRYYADGARGDSADACGLLAPALARTAASTYAASLQTAAKTCAGLLAALLARSRSELSAAVKVVAVGVRGGSAQAVVVSPTLPASSVALAREPGAWRLQALTGQPLP